MGPNGWPKESEELVNQRGKKSCCTYDLKYLKMFDIGCQWIQSNFLKSVRSMMRPGSGRDPKLYILNFHELMHTAKYLSLSLKSYISTVLSDESTKIFV